MELIMYVGKAPLADVGNLLSHPGLSASTYLEFNNNG